MDRDKIRADFGIALDWVRAHPGIAGIVGGLVVGFILGVWA